MTTKKRPMWQIRHDLIDHMDNENGTLNDFTVDALYREAHGIPDDEDTDLETVEAWALVVSNPQCCM